MVNHFSWQVIEYSFFHLTAVEPIAILVDICLKIID